MPSRPLPAALIRPSARRRRPLLLALALVAATATACSSASEKVADRIVDAAAGQDADVRRRDDGGYDITTDEGTASFGTTDIPASWPDDVPFPSDFRPTTSSSIGGAEGTEYVSVVGETRQSFDQVDAFYAKAMAGWSESIRIGSTNDGAEMRNVGYEQGDRQLLVGLQSTDEANLLSLTYTVEP